MVLNMETMQDNEVDDLSESEAEIDGKWWMYQRPSVVDVSVLCSALAPRSSWTTVSRRTFAFCR
jgi:hypothetical protein